MKFPTMIGMTICAMITARGLPQLPDNIAILGVYVGTSTCDDPARSFLKVPAGASCDRLKWKLTLYENPATHAPAGYRLDSEYGYHIDNRTYKTSGRNSIEGSWAIAKGIPANKEAIVYQLNPGNPSLTLSFVRLDQNLLHILDKDKNLMVGDGGQSYTLSRVTN